MLVPLLLYGALGALDAGTALLTHSSLPFASRARLALQPLKFVAWVAGATLGMATLWAVVIEATDPPGPWFRAVLAIGLVLGVAAALAWFYTMATSRTTYDLQTWLVWVVILGAPVVIAVRHLRRLATAQPAS